MREIGINQFENMTDTEIIEHQKNYGVIMDHDIWEGGSLNQKRPRPEIKGIFDDTESTLFESFAESSAGTALGYVIKGGGILLAAFILGLIICFANGFGSHL